MRMLSRFQGFDGSVIGALMQAPAGPSRSMMLPKQRMLIRKAARPTRWCLMLKHLLVGTEQRPAEPSTSP